MKIGVISDTHIPEAAAQLPAEIFRAFEKFDLILHAGDILDTAVLEELAQLAEVRAVRGNMDYFSRTHSLPEMLIVEAGAFRIGVIHGSGPPYRLPERMLKQFNGVHCVVFGHSHQPYNETLGGVLMFNPGSPTDRRYAPYLSYGVLEVGDKIRGRIVTLR
jgi:hypothetical protein